MLKLFSYFINDWTCLEAIPAYWLTDCGYEPIVYEIEYSEIRSKIRLKCEGFKCKKHPKYREAVERLNYWTFQLNKKVNAAV